MRPVDFAGFVDDLATQSGRAILPFFRTALTALDKSSGGVFDPVTEADKAAEVAMRRLIKASFPEHGIVGEEFGSEREDAELVWVLDPIDGTRAFMSGLPLWGTLIGLLRGGRAAYGMMHQPFIGERFFGDGGSASYRGPHGNRTLHTRRCASLAEATLSTTSPTLFKSEEAGRYGAVEERVKLTRYGYDCYAYCMLAAGHLDIVVEAGLKPYDIVALVPIIEGAGGIVTTWTGDRPEKGGTIVASGDRRLHEEALALLGGEA
ncbi:histidinol-phosphatase [Enterovirga rhinocerotis]|uniref:Histidinol-phosphatase n=1 Tax=Enterovirga rhinocerotis TaxID=1339210 RepID=A0A4R7C6X3_9HYPH|nr:histidinol-phosphatase [Enterovirga rhinocerotis]TDR94011.1 myo-inositol-1(or 4)-monophosphatase [Enterovirga rhinocerotis]